TCSAVVFFAPAAPAAIFTLSLHDALPILTGEAPLVDSKSASLGSLVDERTIRELPLNGRSWDQIAILQPAVTAVDAGNLAGTPRSEEHTSELQSRFDLVCRLLLEKKNKNI